MTRFELLRCANRGYPYNYLSRYYDKAGRLRDGNGDTLALFIVRELCATFDPKVTTRTQLAAAVGALQRAQQDLAEVIEALRREATTGKKEEPSEKTGEVHGKG